MKHIFKKLFVVLFAALMAMSLLLCACEPIREPAGPGDTGVTDPGDKDPDDQGKDDKDDKDPDQGDDPYPDGPPVFQEFEVVYRTDYTPTRFSEVKSEVTDLAEGVHLVANTVTLANGKTSLVYTIEIELDKANVVAGTKNNEVAAYDWGKDTPYAMAQAWEKATGGQVYASINADFFGSTCVNAFVKDGVILKAGHNDNGNYEYGDASDLPASAPMLFGVKGTSAQIAPIVSVEGDPTEPAVKKQIVQAKLFYGLAAGGETIEVRENEKVSNTYVTYLTEGGNSQLSGVAVKVDTTGGATSLKVLEVMNISKRQSIRAGAGFAWLQTNAKSGAAYQYLSSLHEGDTLGFTVMSPDGAWDGYETILGCRQALVIDDSIAATVTLEPSNRAQSTDVPRTAVGLKEGRVVLIAVESMYYYNRDKAGDTHGMNLPELAEFAYYYGCTQAANFDGGGSTQLVVRGQGEEEARVIIRSADTAGTGLFDTRPVINAFLVTSRKEN